MVNEAAVAMMALPMSSMMTGRPALGPMKVCTTGRQNAPMFSPEALSIWYARYRGSSPWEPRNTMKRGIMQANSPNTTSHSRFIGCLFVAKLITMAQGSVRLKTRPCTTL